MNLQTQRNPETTSGQLKGRRPASSLVGSGEGIRLQDPKTITVESPVIGHKQRSHSVATPRNPVIQPRMSQLETLEAKMASIEVSLSSTPRRKKNGSISGASLSSSIQSIPKELAVKELEKLRNALRDKENIIQSLKGQLTIPGLRLNVIRNANNNNMKELTEVEKKQAGTRLCRLKTDVDNKRLSIKNLKMALERLDITDNIDVRIQQAELEYQLGREELNLLTLLEETRALQMCIEESNRNSLEYHTLYSCVHGKGCVLLQALQIDYDQNNPKFGAGPKESVPGLYVDWALKESNLIKGDRLIEVNGKIVLNKSREDLIRLLAAAPDPAQIVILREVTESVLSIGSLDSTASEVSLRNELDSFRERADEAHKAKEGLKSDNIRLTHRISYLEEQVSELLSRKPEMDSKQLRQTSMISKSNQNVTNINIQTHSPSNSSSPNPDRQICQKGNQIIADTKEQICVPIRSKSSLSNLSNSIAPSINNDYCQKLHTRHKHRSSRSGVQSPIGNTSPNDKVSYRKHTHHYHHHHREKDYSSETNSGVDVRRYSKKNDINRYSTDFVKANSEKEYNGDIMDQSFKKATQIVQELTRNRDSALYEKHRQKCITASEKYNVDILRHYNSRKSTSVLDFRSEIHIGPKYDSKSVEHIDENEICANGNVFRKLTDARSVKSLDFDSDCNSTNNRRANGTSSNIDYTSEPNNDKKIYYTNSYEHIKPRPTPPKKPLRLSLHKTHSLQSVETNSYCQNKNERKSVKRNYKGETPITLRPQDKNGINYQMKWNHRSSFENTLENGSWC